MFRHHALNKLSRIFIYRLGKGRVETTSLPSWGLHSTQDVGDWRLRTGQGAHAHRPCRERRQWQRREGAGPALRAPQSARRAAPLRGRPARAPAQPTCGGAGREKSPHLPNSVKAMVKVLAARSPVHALLPGGLDHRIGALTPRAGRGELDARGARRERLQAGTRGAAARKS
jgi:hypothetical protein